MIRLIVDTEEKGLVEAFGRQLVKKLDDNLYELRSKVGSNIQREMYFQIIKREYEIATEESLAADAVYLMRTQLGMTQTELANAANKSQSAIARIENGSVVPNITTLTEIASAVGKKVKLEIV